MKTFSNWLKKVGVLACKPQRGSQGQGFYKFSFHDGKYYLNHQEASKAEITEILNNEESQYLITEYIQMHPTLKKIYDGAVNTAANHRFQKRTEKHRSSAMPICVSAHQRPAP